MSDESRRNFLSNSAKLLAGSVAFVSVNALASSHEGPMHGASGEGTAIDATATDTCATCQYWGGMRKVSEDKAQVVAQSMGWCNNPDSMNFRKLTNPDHVMQKTGIWKKWIAL